MQWFAPHPLPEIQKHVRIHKSKVEYYYSVDSFLNTTVEIHAVCNAQPTAHKYKPLIYITVLLEIHHCTVSKQLQNLI